MLIFISDRSDFSHTIRTILTKEGVFLFSCALETGEFFCEKKEIGGVILDCVENETSGEKLCRSLRAKYPELPISAIVGEHAFPDLQADRIFREPNLSLLVPQILDFCRLCGWDPEPLSLFHRYINNLPSDTLYMGYPLSLSRKEHLLVRCLFYCFPVPAPASDLIVLCYPDKICRIGNIAQLVRSVNLRAAEIDPHPLIINEYGKGYLLRPDLFYGTAPARKR